MDTKNFLASKTFQGLIIMVLTLVLPKLGVRLADADTQQIAEILIQCIAAAWIAIGRITASKGITLGTADSGGAANKLGALLLVASLGLGLGVTGCAMKTISQLTGPEQARVAAQELLLTWQGAYEQYTALEPTFTPDERAKAQATVAPAINRAKPAVLAFASAANIWTITAGQNATAGQEVQAIAAEAGSIVAQVLSLINQIRR